MLPGVKGSWAEGHGRQGVLDEVPVDPELHQPGGATGHLWSASTATVRLVRPAEELQRALVEHLGELPLGNEGEDGQRVVTEGRG